MMTHGLFATQLTRTGYRTSKLCTLFYSTEKKLSNMFGQRCFIFFVLLIFLETALKIEGGSVTVSNNYLTLRGNAHIKFLEPQERVWAGLSNGRRYPVIHSGNRIALRVMYSSYSTRWLRCYYSSYCHYSTCPGAKIMRANKWSSCTYEQFYIRGVNKNDGQTITSGDFITLAPYRRGSTCRLRCFSSTSTKCNSQTCVSESYFKGNNAFYYSYLTFQIFARNAVDGIDPVQYGDTVGFRYPFYNPSHWLYFNGNYLYARSCSRNSKSSCAYKSNLFGFQIFKPL